MMSNMQDLSNACTQTQPSISAKNLLIALQPVVKQHLQSPRGLASQTQQQLADTYNCHDEAQEALFLQGKTVLKEPLLPYEWDILLSPSYTPSKEERLRYLLPMGLGHCSPFTLQQLIGYVTSQGIEGCLVRQDGSELRFPLPEPTIEGFITKLGLHKPLCPETGRLLLSHADWNTLTAYDQQGCLFALRQDIWQKTELRRNLLKETLLPIILQQPASTWNLLLDTLTSHATSYRPKSLEDLLKQLHSVKASCEQDLEQVTARGFHHDEIKARYQDEEIIERLGQKNVQHQYQHWIHQTNQLLNVFQ
ncbi:MAG: hypothetical protein ACKO37_04410 [Vampirovibrionales bacterium]